MVTLTEQAEDQLGPKRVTRKREKKLIKIFVQQHDGRNFHQGKLTLGTTIESQLILIRELKSKNNPPPPRLWVDPTVVNLIKHFTSVIYNSRVALTRNLPI